MKTLKSILVTVACLMLTMNVFSATKTYSHLPIPLKGFIEQELRNPEQKTEEQMVGHVIIEFYVDENCQIQVVGLSSNNIELGEFVKNELQNLPAFQMDCPKGVVFEIKVRLAYT